MPGWPHCGRWVHSNGGSTVVFSSESNDRIGFGKGHKNESNRSIIRGDMQCMRGQGLDQPPSIEIRLRTYTISHAFGSLYSIRSISWPHTSTHIGGHHFRYGRTDKRSPAFHNLPWTTYLVAASKKHNTGFNKQLGKDNIWVQLNHFIPSE